MTNVIEPAVNLSDFVVAVDDDHGQSNPQVSRGTE